MTFHTRNLVFDLDGVLIDTHALHQQALRDAMEISGFEYHPEHDQDTASSRVKLERMGVSAGIGVEIIYQRKRELYQERLPQFLRPNPELIAFIQRLVDSGFHLGVCSNSHFESAVYGLRLSGLYDVFASAEHFSFVAGGHPAGIKSKPHPDPYLKVAVRMGVCPEDILVFEDSESGIQSAQAAGCQVKQVTYATIVQQLEKYTCE